MSLVSCLSLHPVFSALPASSRAANAQCQHMSLWGRDRKQAPDNSTPRGLMGRSPARWGWNRRVNTRGAQSHPLDTGCPLSAAPSHRRCGGWDQADCQDPAATFLFLDVNKGRPAQKDNGASQHGDEGPQGFSMATEKPVPYPSPPQHLLLTSCPGLDRCWPPHSETLGCSPTLVPLWLGPQLGWGDGERGGKEGKCCEPPACTHARTHTRSVPAKI